MMTSLSVLRYRRFSDFQRGIFFTLLFLNYGRYKLDIFNDGRQKTEKVHEGLK